MFINHCVQVPDLYGLAMGEKEQVGTAGVLFFSILLYSVQVRTPY